MTQTYVITGTSRGLGLEMTRQLLKTGNTVFALARAPEKSKALMELKEKNPERLSLFTVDTTSDSDVSAFLKKLPPQTQVDVLINNAGVIGEEESFEKLSFDEVTKTFETNALGPMRMTRALLPYLKMSPQGKVLHITSLMGSISDNSSGGYYGYRISKAALNMFHKSFSIDFPQLVSLVMHPGWVQTDMGGDSATTTPEESVRGILSVLAKSTPKDNGKFFDYEGDTLPW